FAKADHSPCWEHSRHTLRSDAANPRSSSSSAMNRYPNTGCCRRQRGYGIVLRAAAEKRSRPALVGHPPAAAAGDRDLDRSHLPPATTPTRPFESPWVWFRFLWED